MSHRNALAYTARSAVRGFKGKGKHHSKRTASSVPEVCPPVGAFRPVLVTDPIAELGVLDFLVPAWAKERSAFFEPSYRSDFLSNGIDSARDRPSSEVFTPLIDTQYDLLGRNSVRGRNTASLLFLAQPNLALPSALPASQARFATTVTASDPYISNDYLAALRWAQGQGSPSLSLEQQPLQRQQLLDRSHFTSADHAIRHSWAPQNIVDDESRGSAPSRWVERDVENSDSVSTVALIMSNAGKFSEESERWAYLATSLLPLITNAPLENVVLDLLIPYWDITAGLLIPYYDTKIRQTAEIVAARKTFVGRFPAVDGLDFNSNLCQTMLNLSIKRNQISDKGKVSVLYLTALSRIANFWQGSRKAHLQCDLTTSLAYRLWRARLLQRAWQVRHIALQEKKLQRTYELEHILDRIDRTCLMAKVTDAQQIFTGPLLSQLQVPFHDQLESSISTIHRLIRLKQPQKAAALLRKIFPASRPLETYAKVMASLCALAPKFGLLDALWADLMQSRMYSPNTDIYTAMILANAADHHRVIDLYQEMLQDGVRCDSVASTVIMNALISHGDFRSIRRVFESMTSRDLLAYNTYLKAAVAARRPAKQVLQSVAAIQQAGFRPSARTWTLVLESLSDAGLLNAMEAVFASMDDESSANACRPTIHHFSIMIKTFYRKKKEDVAFEYLAELRKRKDELGTSAILYSQLFNGFAATQDLSLEKAQSLLRSYLDEVSMVDRRGLFEIMVPLMANFLDRFRPADALALFQMVIDVTGGGVGDLSKSDVANTTLLDAYKQSDDLERIRELWAYIYANAKATKRNSVAPSNQLCIPFSIVIQALSKADMLGQILAIWKSMQNNGFGFDNQNWNDLARACIACGQLEAGFWIVERVFLLSTKSRIPSFMNLFLPEIVPSDPITPSRQYQSRRRERARLASEGGLDESIILSPESSEAQVVTSPRSARRLRRHATYRTLLALSQALAEIDATLDGIERRGVIEREFPLTMRKIRTLR